MEPAPHIPRMIADRVRESLDIFRVTIITGARQVGKSTLAREIVAERGGEERTLDDPDMLDAALEDPVTFVRAPGTLLIDEVQRAPGLALAIKAAVDREPTRGRFLLTGSTRLLGIGALPDSLTGRAEYIELWPLAQIEIERALGWNLVAWLFAPTEPGRKRRTPGLRDDCFGRVERGGMPEPALALSPEARERLLDTYLRQIVERDIAQVSDIRHRREMRRLLALLAVRISQPLNVEALARDVRLPRTTVERYLDLLDLVGFLRLVPAWSPNPSKRAIRRPKLGIVDSGLATRLVGQDARRMAAPGGRGGHLLESFVLMEIERLLPMSGTGGLLHHYRDDKGREVDGVIEAPDGRVACLEVKAASTVTARDARGIRHLAGMLGDRFAAGVVLHTGASVVPLGDRIWALPIDALWCRPD